MPSRAWWAPVVQVLVWGALMSLVMGWLARARLKPVPDGREKRLVQPTGTLVVGIVGFVFFAGIAVLSHVFSNRTTTWLTTTCFVGFALFSLLAIGEYFLGRHAVSDSGLEFSRLTWTRGRLKWMELRNVRYAPTLKWFRLETHGGDVARISASLVGLPVFARLLLRHAPADCMDAGTRELLEATAAGRPPEIW